MESVSMLKDSHIVDIQPNSKEIAIREWVTRQLGDIAHEKRVARVAQMLFQLTRRWHDLGRAESRLLNMAALVHDVGRAHGEEGHAKTGARMILEHAGLPVSEAERRRLAYMTRHHRGAVPEPGGEQHLDAALDPRNTMRLLLGLLRAADSLDSRVLGGPQIVATVHARVLTLCGYIEGDASLAAATLGKPKKLRLLEDTLDCEVRIEWFSTERLAMVS
jgi:exopolyphosphatase/pppGpp-phosphohydrolase